MQMTVHAFAVWNRLYNYLVQTYLQVASRYVYVAIEKRKSCRFGAPDSKFGDWSILKFSFIYKTGWFSNIFFSDEWWKRKIVLFQNMHLWKSSDNFCRVLLPNNHFILWAVWQERFFHFHQLMLTKMHF